MTRILIYLASGLLVALLPTTLRAQDTWDGTFATSFASGDGTESSPYLITSAEEWAYFCELSKTDDFTDKYVKLATDMYFPTTLSNAPHVDTFNGVFDGDGYTVEFDKYRNSNTSSFGLSNYGMFNSLSGTVKNLSFVNVLPSQGKYGSEWFVRLVSRISKTGVVTNCYLRNGGSGGSGYTALVADENYGLIDNCYGILNASAVKVGEVFRNYGLISNCHTKVGYQYYSNNFSWSIYAESGTDKNCDNTIITQDEWKAKIKEIPSTCNVKFYNSNLSPVSVERGSELTLPIPEDYRYTFVQWYYKDEPQPETITVTSDMSLTAYWRRDILSQPTVKIPEFKIQDAYNAEYQWHQIDENAVSYPSWQSTNKADNSVSSHEYVILANEGQQIAIKWRVSSDAYDCLKITVNGTAILTESGINSGCKIIDVPTTGTYTIVATYTKDDDDSEGDDMAQIESVRLSYPDVALTDATTNTLPLAYRQANKGYYCVATYMDKSDAKENIISPNTYSSDTIVFQNTIIAEGKHDLYSSGDIRWYLTDEGLLHIFGKGALPSYISYTYVPWYKYASSILNIEIEDEITAIGDYSFYNCNNLTSITCMASTPPTISNSNAFYNVPRTIPVYVPTANVSKYQSSNVWSTFTNIQPMDAPEPKQCASPVITIEDGEICFACETPNAVFHYTLSAADTSLAEATTTQKVTLNKGIKVTVYATADGYEPSEEIKVTLPLTVGQYGDLNGDGVITVSDVSTLINKVLKK